MRNLVGNLEKLIITASKSLTGRDIFVKAGDSKGSDKPEVWIPLVMQICQIPVIMKDDGFPINNEHYRY